MIIITGATGELGRHIVENLLQRLPSAQIGISVRDPQKAEDLKQRGIRVCKGDFAEPASLLQAFDGAEQVLIVSVNKFGEEAVRQHETAIRAAESAGVKRILYTSHQGANSSSAFAPGRDHAATEALLQLSGVPYVSLRNGFYAESALFPLAKVKQTGKIAVPEDGPVSWTARADLAEAAAMALADPGLFDGISPPLTSSQMLNFSGVAKIASEVLGRSIVREVTSDEEYRSSLVSHGIPESIADGLGGLFKASRAHEFAVVDPTLERLLGRSPKSMRDVLLDHLAKPETQAW